MNDGPSAPMHPISYAVFCLNKKPTTSGLAPVLGARPRSGAPGPKIPRPAVGSGGLGERDLVAKKDLELMDEAMDLAVVVPPGDEEVSAEIAEPRAGVREQVPDDDQDGAGDGDQCLELAYPLGQTSVAFAQEGLGPACGGGGLAQDAFEVGVALAGAGGAVPGAGLDGAGGQLGPRHQVGGSVELGHVEAHLGNDGLRSGASDPGDLVQPFDHRQRCLVS